MNTAARDRALLNTVTDYFKGSEHGRRTPISKLSLSKSGDGGVLVALHTSRPNNVRMESQAITDALKERIGAERSLTLRVVPEARAVAKFVRTSPRKARLVIDAVKGKRVSEAIAMLRFIPNHAAELISKVLISAAANAQDGWGAGVDELKVLNILADGGPSLKRVRPRAQGRAYRILKRTSHLTVILTEAPPVVRPTRSGAVPPKPKAAKAAAAPAAAPAAPAKPAAVAETKPTEDTAAKSAETAKPTVATAEIAETVEPSASTELVEAPVADAETAKEEE